MTATLSSISKPWAGSPPATAGGSDLNLRQTFSCSEESAAEDEERKGRGDGGREEAVDAEGADDKRLKIEEPERRQKHDGDQRDEQASRAVVAVSRERRQTEGGEVCERPHGGD